jgi:Putative adipose-regulatory protein (Seipin)
VIPIVENFNNKDFQANALEFTLSNTSLSFQSVVIRMRTSLFGFRYLMRNWFLTTATIVISSLSVSILVGLVSFYLIVKSSLRSILLKLYPEAKTLKPIIIKK